MVIEKISEIRRRRINRLSLTLITDRSQCKASVSEWVRRALVGGVRTVQIREKGLTTKELYFLAQEIRKITLDFDANLIINDRLDIALAVEADGVHLGWQSIPVILAKRILKPGMLIGVSTHNLQEAITAQDTRADYITFGPIFETQSKLGILTPQGPGGIKQIKTKITIPVIALGGIAEGNVRSVLEMGADGVAVVSQIMRADDPETMARNLYTVIVESTRTYVT